MVRDADALPQNSGQGCRGSRPGTPSRQPARCTSARLHCRRRRHQSETGGQGAGYRATPRARFPLAEAHLLSSAGPSDATPNCLRGNARMRAAQERSENLGAPTLALAGSRVTMVEARWHGPFPSAGHARGQYYSAAMSRAGAASGRPMLGP